MTQMKEREIRFDGNFMKLIRKRARLSFTEIAKRSGTTPRHVSEIEHHRCDPSFSLAVRMSEVLGTSVGYFVIPTPGRPKVKGPATGRSP